MPHNFMPGALAQVTMDGLVHAELREGWAHRRAVGCLERGQLCITITTSVCRLGGREYNNVFVLTSAGLLGWVPRHALTNVFPMHEG